MSRSRRDRAAVLGEHAKSIGQKVVAGWFIANALLVLTPVTYKLLDGQRGEIGGVPLVILYFIATGASVVASVIFAYTVDRREAEVGL